MNAPETAVLHVPAGLLSRVMATPVCPKLITRTVGKLLGAPSSEVGRRLAVHTESSEASTSDETPRTQGYRSTALEQRIFAAVAVIHGNRLETLFEFPILAAAASLTTLRCDAMGRHFFDRTEFSRELCYLALTEPRYSD